MTVSTSAYVTYGDQGVAVGYHPLLPVIPSGGVAVGRQSVFSLNQQDQQQESISACRIMDDTPFDHPIPVGS
jgi:hypothetical protein